jgi:hypothetical protein
MTSQDGQPIPTHEQTPSPDGMPVPGETPATGGAPAPACARPADPEGWAPPTAGPEERWAEPTLQVADGGRAADEPLADDDDDDAAGPSATNRSAALSDDEPPDDEPAVENAFVGDVAAEAEFEVCVVPPLAAGASTSASAFAPVPVTFDPDAAATPDDVSITHAAPVAAGPAPADTIPPVGLLDNLDGERAGDVSAAMAAGAHDAVDVDLLGGRAAAASVVTGAGAAAVASYQSHFLETGDDEPEYVAHVEPAAGGKAAAGVAARAAAPQPAGGEAVAVPNAADPAATWRRTTGRSDPRRGVRRGGTHRYRSRRYRSRRHGSRRRAARHVRPPAEAARAVGRPAAATPRCRQYRRRDDGRPGDHGRGVRRRPGGRLGG